jgi:pyruvate formate lyase activating enzyme
MALLSQGSQRGLHTVLDTSGHASSEIMEDMLPFVSLMLYDVKHMDPIAHKRLTGVSNERVLDNARLLIDRGFPMVVRVPVIPTCNDSLDNMRATAEFFRSARGLQYVELLPYHRLGESKWERLGKTYRLPGLAAPRKQDLEPLASPFREAGLEVRLG